MKVDSPTAQVQNTPPAPTPAAVTRTPRNDRDAEAPRVVTPPAAETSAPATPTQVAEKQLRQAAEELQRRVSLAAPGLDISIDNETGHMIIKVIDRDTKEVIRQIPPEEVMQLDKEIERLQGMLLNKKA